MTDIATTSATTSTWVRRTGVVGATAVVTLAVFFALRDGAGVDMAVRIGDAVDHVGPAAVAVTSVAAALAGWGLLAMLEHIAARGRPVWTIVAAVL